MSYFDPFMNSLMGVTPNPNGTVTVNASGVTVPADPFGLPTFNVPTNAQGVASTPDTSPSPLPGGTAADNFWKAITGQPPGAGTKAVAGALPNIASALNLPNIQGDLITAAVLLLAVLVVAIGLWSIVK